VEEKRRHRTAARDNVDATMIAFILVITIPRLRFSSLTALRGLGVPSQRRFDCDAGNACGTGLQEPGAAASETQDLVQVRLIGTKYSGLGPYLKSLYLMPDA
jgi:hypothetical protein